MEFPQTMIPKTASVDSPVVVKLCEKLVKNPNPLYLDVEPLLDGAQTGECTQNVERLISIKGGSVQYGWQIWEMKRMVESEFHAVWVDDNGVLHDITPKGLFNISRILFLPDETIVYTGMQIDNVRIPVDENDFLIKKFIQVNERYFEACNRGELADQYGEIMATPEMIQIMREMDQISLQLILTDSTKQSRPTFHSVSRNALCPCGSGKKYKRCHGS